jgi:hypothetical protein
MQKCPLSNFSYIYREKSTTTTVFCLTFTKAFVN